MTPGAYTGSAIEMPGPVSAERIRQGDNQQRALHSAASRRETTTINDPDVNTTPATVVLVPPEAESVASNPCRGGGGEVCKTTLNTNGRPTLCDCGQIVYKMDPTMVEPYADGETVA